MLKFFKKQGSNQQTFIEAITSPLGPETKIQCETSQHRPLSIDLASFDDEGLFDVDEIYTREPSRLSRTLNEVLSDKSALSCFIQFMESRNALSLLQCWLDIENFHSSLQQQHSRKSISKTDHDSLSVSTDCDSLTCDLTEDLPLADCGSKTTSPVPSGDFVDEALGIFKKYVALEAPQSVNCSEEIRNSTVENICTSENTTPFEQIQTFVAQVMEKDFFQAFLQSDFFCKHQIDVLTSDHVVLDDILSNETALFYFMEFLEQENNRFLLEFWLAATNFHQHLENPAVDPIEAQNDAVILYDKYFSLQALCPLGFSDKVRFTVEQNICGENGLITDDCFSLPLKIVEQVLDRNFLKPFMASQLFYKFLSELINTVQSIGDCVYEERSKRLSECSSSERSFSTQNSAFLAMEVPEMRKAKKKADMNIDTRELYDPDALWKRKKHDRLTFGYVTALGQFVTDFEPEPDKRTTFNLRSVVKRFVNMEDVDKKKEELAWQVAEMIVKSITSVTLTDAEQNDNKL